MIFVTFVVSIILFAIYKSVPADPVMMQLDGLQGDMTPAEFEALMEWTRIDMGLDGTMMQQYFRWAGRVIRLDFGRSSIHRRPVVDVVLPRMANTLKLNIAQLIIVFMIVIPLGISTAVRKGTVYDNIVQVVTILGFSLPVFVLALLAILIFGVWLDITPVSGTMTASLEILGAPPWRLMLDRAWFMILPVGTMVFASLAGLTRYVRATMIDALRMDYIRTARAKGLREKVVIYSHAFRNSLVPFVTIMVGWFVGLFGGSLMIESIFGWNGMGLLFFQSIRSFDYSVVMGLATFYVVLGLVGWLIMDVLYTFVDPRVRLS
jgi:peptide/nickel transport system permease protein